MGTTISQIKQSATRKFYDRDIFVDTKDGLPTSMKDALEDNSEEYFHVPHKEWWDLLSTMKLKCNSRIYAAQIKRLSTSKAVPVNYESDESIKLPRKKKKITGVLLARK